MAMERRKSNEDQEPIVDSAATEQERRFRSIEDRAPMFSITDKASFALLAGAIVFGFIGGLLIMPAIGFLIAATAMFVIGLLVGM